MNERLEINGDLADEYREIQEAEYREVNEGAPVVELDEDDLEAWYQDWCKRNGVCTVHGGNRWRGGYCNLWATNTGKGPCILPE